MLAFWHRIPRTEKLAIGLSLVLGALLLVVKFIAYGLTHSAAIFSDAVESIVNVMASCVALWSLALAHTPPDELHPYGHGKVEFISAAFEGGMISLAALFIFLRTLDQFLHPTEFHPADAGLWLMIAAMILNGLAGLWLVRLGRRADSLTLEADGHHLLADAITSVAVVASLVVVKLTGWHWADPAMAMLIAVYIAGSGVRIMRQSFGGLMDQQDAGDERHLVALLDSHTGPAAKFPAICSYHKLRHRHSGRFHWVDFHLVVPPGLTVDDGHRIASIIEYEIEQMLGNGNATAHVEPVRDEGVCDVQ